MDAAMGASSHQMVLPNEIIRNISLHLHPGDIENFSMVSRRFYILSKEALDEHNSRKRAFREIDDKDPLTIPNMLENPKLCWYIKRLVIYHNRQGHLKRLDDAAGLGDADLTLQGFYDYERLQHIQSIVDQSPYADSIYVKEYMSKVKLGGDDLLKLLLLFHTPNLESLIVTRHKNWNCGFVDILAYELHRFALGSKKSKPPMLARLSELRLSHKLARSEPMDGLHVPPLRMFQIGPFLTLPSLNTFAIGLRDLHDPDDDIHSEPMYTWEYGPHTSSVTHLDLGFTIFDSVNYDEFFGGFRCLRSFMIGAAPVNLVVDSLLKHHKDTLEVLQVDFTDDYNATAYRDCISLRGFTVLHSLSLDCEQLLVRSERHTRKAENVKDLLVDLADILPPSLKHLKLTRYANHGLSSLIIKALISLLGRRDNTGSNLRAICIRNCVTGNLTWRNGRGPQSDPLAELHAACKARNIALHDRFDSDCPTYACNTCLVSVPVLGEGIDYSQRGCDWNNTVFGRPCLDWRPMHECHCG